MFKVDPTRNRLVRMEKRRFAELKLGERSHLQEWIAGMPQALGEELLIIQKEFDGFAGTRERLDLLALDKEGTLVVIENKLDDSGRDVVWQGLKYVAYCSSLTKAQIVEIYQKYLDRWSPGARAVPNLCAFLDIEELDEMVLNEGNVQRLLLIAANFRKEVTGTVLWLLGHGVRAQCLQARAYSSGEDVFIDLRQIIPPRKRGISSLVWPPRTPRNVPRMARRSARTRSVTRSGPKRSKRYARAWRGSRPSARRMSTP